MRSHVVEHRSSRWSLARLGATLMMGLTLVTVGVAGSVAQPDAPGSIFVPPRGCDVVADGLFNPRDVALGADGTVYVSEAGRAGDEQVVSPESGEVVTTRGTTGQVTAIGPDGERSVLAGGFASYGVGFEVFGPTGIVATEGTVYLAIGGAGPASPLVTPLETENAVVAIDVATGEVTHVADTNAYERTTNPDPHQIDSDVYGLARAVDGTLFVADAGGNAVYRVDPVTKELAVHAVVPGLPIANPPAGGNPARSGEQTIDPVPTALEIGPDGTLYLGLLSGGPFPAGGAKILRVGADGTLGDAATGLTMIVGVAAAPDGELYATQLSTDFLAEVPAAGNVLRVGADGVHEVVLDGLPFPNGITFDGAGDLYVVVNSVAAPESAPTGMVLRCDLGEGEGANGPAEPDTPAGGDVQNDADGEADVTIGLTDIRFETTVLTIPAGRDVTIRLENRGVAAHDFNIDALGTHSVKLRPGESTTVTVNAAAGMYEFYCSLPGHRAAGMVGTMIVEEMS